MKVKVGKWLDKWPDVGQNLDKLESGRFPASERRILLMRMVGQSIDVLNKQNDLDYKLFRKTGMTMTADRSDDEDITLERMELLYTFVAAGVRLGVIIFGQLDLLGFHCATRMVTQGIGFCRSRYSLDQVRAGDRKIEAIPKRSVDQMFDAKLTSQGLTSSSNLARCVYSTSA